MNIGLCVGIVIIICCVQHTSVYLQWMAPHLWARLWSLVASVIPSMISSRRASLNPVRSAVHVLHDPFTVQFLIAPCSYP